MIFTFNTEQSRLSQPDLHGSIDLAKGLIVVQTTAELKTDGCLSWMPFFVMNKDTN